MIQFAIEKANRVLVIAHVDPDGDAIGSLTAAGQALQQLGKRVTLVCDDAEMCIRDRLTYCGQKLNRLERVP